MVRLLRLVSCLVLVLFCHITGFSYVVHVPGDSSTIQGGLFGVQGPGDTVLVAPGTYYESWLFFGLNDLVLMSEMGPESTIIDAGSEEYCYENSSRTAKTHYIKGFTITNATYGVGIGGNQDNHINLENVIITNCYTAVGAGSRCTAKNCRLYNNEIGFSNLDEGTNANTYSVDSCILENNDYALDGYIDVSNSIIRNGLIGIRVPYEDARIATINVANCLIEGFVDKVMLGGDSVILDNCIIRENAGYVVSAMSLDVDHPVYMEFNNCIIDGNNQGIFIEGNVTGLSMSNCQYSNNIFEVQYICESESYLNIQNCTFVNNEGTAIVYQYPDIPEQNISISENIIAFNGKGFYSPDYMAGAYISCCDVFGNSDGNYDGFPDQTGLNGNISKNPVFCHPDTGNYYLHDLSPCMPSGNGCGVLIGAYGAGCSGFICGDANGDGLVNILDVTYLIAFLYMGGPAPVLEIAADVNSSGDINILDVTYLISYLYNEGPGPLCTTATEPTGHITDYSNCLDYPGEKGVTAVDDTLDCIEYSYDGESILNLYHRNAELNCCPVIVADIAIEDNMIIVEELDSLYMGGCPCLCLFNIDYQIYNLPPGTYTIKIIEPYVWPEEEQLEFIVDLSGPTEGSHCVYRDEYPWGQW